jgi:hypothetical protein
MSEVKLNLIDTQKILYGITHGSIAEAAVAALSAEPDTVAELEAAMGRYIKPSPDSGAFVGFASGSEIDEQPWDAGIVIIDLAARIIASESTYSDLTAQGEIRYHDGQSLTDVPVLYRIPDDWILTHSLAGYRGLAERRRKERAAESPLDARAVLYGRPLLEWIVDAVTDADPASLPANTAQLTEEQLGSLISEIHARWLLTPCEALRGYSPRHVLLARQEFIDFDLHSRSLQWSLQDEGPPCLSSDSHAYQFAGFGTHEWVIYYDLVRYLLWNAFGVEHHDGDPEMLHFVHDALAEDAAQTIANTEIPRHINRYTLAEPEEGELPPSLSQAREQQLARLEELKNIWLNQPHSDYDERVPAVLIENERKRLPIAMLPRDMIIDDDCPVCQMMANPASPLGMGVGFWHLNGAHMDDDFAFSTCRTPAEWEAENQRREEFDREFNRRWEEREDRRGREMPVEELFDLDRADGGFR